MKGLTAVCKLTTRLLPLLLIYMMEISLHTSIARTLVLLLIWENDMSLQYSQQNSTTSPFVTCSTLYECHCEFQFKCYTLSSLWSSKNPTRKLPVRNGEMWGVKRLAPGYQSMNQDNLGYRVLLWRHTLGSYPLHKVYIVWVSVYISGWLTEAWIGDFEVYCNKIYKSYTDILDVRVQRLTIQ